MAQVFISYAQQDRSRVRALVEALEGRGLTVFWDPKLRAGEMYRVVLRSELDAAACVAVVWSAASVRSDWVIWEASHGKRRKILVPVLIDDLDALELPPEFSGQHAHRLDAGSREFSNQMHRFVDDVVAVASGPSGQPAESTRSLGPTMVNRRAPWRAPVVAGVVAAVALSYWFFIGSEATKETQPSLTAASTGDPGPDAVPDQSLAVSLPQASDDAPREDTKPPAPEAKPTSSNVATAPKSAHANAAAQPTEAPAVVANVKPPVQSGSAGSSLLNGSGESQYKLARQYELAEGTGKNEEQALKLYRQSVEAGFGQALLPLARMLRDGRGGPANPEEAVKYFQIGADRGDAAAQFELAGAYLQGKGVPKNEALGVKWLTAAAEQGLGAAQNDLGRAYALGLGVEADDKAAVAWYYKSAAQGNAVAQENLGHRYRLGKGVRQSDTEAFAYFLKSAKQGYASAENLVGSAYLNGTGVVKDAVEARSWFQKAADHGDAHGQTNVAARYEIEGNYLKAAQWYEKAAAQNDAHAQRKLGFIYLDGKGNVLKDRAAAMKYLRAAADQGEALAQAQLAFTLAGSSDAVEVKEGIRWALAAADKGPPHVAAVLGVAYETGLGVARDDATAVKWYREAADKGIAFAQVGLGRMLYNGRGVERDERAGFEWYRKAVDQGDKDGEHAVGLVYLNGNSEVSPDPATASGWFKKAMDHGHLGAKVLYAGMLMGQSGVPADKAEGVRLLQEAADAGSSYAAAALGMLYEKGDGVAKSLKKAKEWYAVAVKLGHAGAQKELERLGK